MTDDLTAGLMVLVSLVAAYALWGGGLLLTGHPIPEGSDPATFSGLAVSLFLVGCMVFGILLVILLAAGVLKYTGRTVLDVKDAAMRSRPRCWVSGGHTYRTSLVMDDDSADYKLRQECWICEKTKDGEKHSGQGS